MIWCGTIRIRRREPHQDRLRSIYMAGAIFYEEAAPHLHMAEERKLSILEIRKAIATSLTAAFGFVIALMWNGVVQSGFATAGIPLGTTAAKDNWIGWAYFLVSAI